MKGSQRHGARSALFAAAALVLACSAVGHASRKVVPFAAPGDGFRVSDLTPRPAAGVEEYTETWTFRTWSADGSSVLVRFVLTNMGPGSKIMRMETRIRRPSGEILHTNPSFGGDWIAPKGGGRFSLKVGPNLISGGPSKYLVHTVSEDGDFEVSLWFRNVVPAWTPGNGDVTFDSELGKPREYHIDVIAPRARVAGKLRIGDTSIEVKGPGYAQHDRNTIVGFKMARHWYRFQGFTPTHTVDYLEFRTPKRFDEVDVRWLMVAEGPRVILTDLSPTLEASDRRPCRETSYGYAPPWKWKVSGHEGDASITGMVRATEMRNTHDFLATMSLLERTIARGLTRPVEYDQHCSFSFELKAGPDAPAIPISGVTDGCGVVFLK